MKNYLLVLVSLLLYSCKKELKPPIAIVEPIVNKEMPTTISKKIVVDDKLTDSILYSIKDVPSIRELLQLNLISKQEFDKIPKHKNLQFKKLDNKVDSLKNNSFGIQLNDGTYKVLTEEKDLYYTIDYLGHVASMEVLLLYVSDDDNESPYRLYSSITGEKLYHLRESPSFSPNGKYAIYADENIAMGDGNIWIVKKNVDGKLIKLLENKFTHWVRKAELGSESEYHIKWVNDKTFALEITFRSEFYGIGMEIGYLKVTIL